MDSREERISWLQIGRFVLAIWGINQLFLFIRMHHCRVPNIDYDEAKMILSWHCMCKCDNWNAKAKRKCHSASAQTCDNKCVLAISSKPHRRQTKPRTLVSILCFEFSVLCVCLGFGRFIQQRETNWCLRKHVAHNFNEPRAFWRLHEMLAFINKTHIFMSANLFKCKM